MSRAPAPGRGGGFAYPSAGGTLRKAGGRGDGGGGRRVENSLPGAGSRTKILAGDANLRPKIRLAALAVDFQNRSCIGCGFFSKLPTARRKLGRVWVLFQNRPKNGLKKSVKWTPKAKKKGAKEPKGRRNFAPKIAPKMRKNKN